MHMSTEFTSLPLSRAAAPLVSFLSGVAEILRTLVRLPHGGELQEGVRRINGLSEESLAAVGRTRPMEINRVFDA